MTHLWCKPFHSSSLTSHISQTTLEKTFSRKETSLGCRCSASRCVFKKRCDLFIAATLFYPALRRCTVPRQNGQLNFELSCLCARLSDKGKTVVKISSTLI